MKVLLELSISYITEENYWVEHPIGLFQSTEAIEEVMKKIMSRSGRFSEHNCEVRISEIEVIGEIDNAECVYRFYGQNIDFSSDEDIIESRCYVDKQTAIQDLLKAKQDTPRQQWHLNTHIIGKYNW